MQKEYVTSLMGGPSTVAFPWQEAHYPHLKFIQLWQHQQTVRCNQRVTFNGRRDLSRWIRLFDAAFRGCSAVGSSTASSVRSL